ncbi:hypothetical protein RHECNPAF_1340061 [Rhizobium etli CNPAF512]|nr:hypothetical protein RHECNPAF_1340061 [Rhizobium etli CNPAF512]
MPRQPSARGKRLGPRRIGKAGSGSSGQARARRAAANCNHSFYRLIEPVTSLRLPHPGHFSTNAKLLPLPLGADGFRARHYPADRLGYDLRHARRDGPHRGARSRHGERDGVCRLDDHDDGQRHRRPGDRPLAWPLWCGPGAFGGFPDLCPRPLSACRRQRRHSLRRRLDRDRRRRRARPVGPRLYRRRRARRDERQAGHCRADAVHRAFERHLLADPQPAQRNRRLALHLPHLRRPAILHMPAAASFRPAETGRGPCRRRHSRHRPGAAVEGGAAQGLPADRRDDDHHHLHHLRHLAVAARDLPPVRGLAGLRAAARLGPRRARHFGAVPRHAARPARQSHPQRRHGHRPDAGQLPDAAGRQSVYAAARQFRPALRLRLRRHGRRPRASAAGAVFAARIRPAIGAAVAAAEPCQCNRPGRLHRHPRPRRHRPGAFRRSRSRRLVAHSGADADDAGARCAGIEAEPGHLMRRGMDAIFS